MVVCEGVLENKQTADFILGNLDKLAKTENMFFFLEEEIGDKILEEFKNRLIKSKNTNLLMVLN